MGRNFSETWGVRRISLRINGGERIALLGANGAGKSTLLRLMAGWYPTAEGDIHLGGRRLRNHSTAVRRQLMLLDDPIPYDAPAIDTIIQAIEDYQADRPGIEAGVADWFDRLRLVGTYRKTSRSVSKGQRFKVAMICLFVIRPPIWLLDEPFSMGLDAGGLEMLEQEMIQHAATGGVVVFSSQWPQHARRLASRAIVLHHGTCVLDSLINQPVDPTQIRQADPALASVLSGLS